MKHKVGDKVKIKSKEWWDSQQKNSSGDVSCGADFFTMEMTRYCGQVMRISYVSDNIYLLEGIGFNWTDEMFEDSEPHPSEILLQDIANVIKSHDMGVQISEEDGKLIIEPLTTKEDLPVDTPVMVSDDDINFTLRYYAGNGEVFNAGQHDAEIEGTCHYDSIIPWDEFDPKDISESLKHNIVKE